MSDALSTATGAAPAPPIDPDTYQFDTSAAGNVSFRSMLDDVAADADDRPQAQSSASQDQKARDAGDHNAADNIQLPPDQPPGGSGPTPGSFGASIAWGGCVAEHTVVGAAKGAVMGGASGAVIGAGYGAAGGAEAGTLVTPGFGTLGGAAAGAAAGAVTGATVGTANGAYIGSAAGIADGIDHCGDTTSQPQPADHIVEHRGVTGLTMPTIPISLNGTPGGLRSRSEPGDDSEQKAGVDSENQVADKTAAADYPTIQNPTEGPNPPLTRERMIAEGLDPKKNPDLLLSNRVFDTYTPKADRASSVREGIADKINRRQTHRVVVDLRQTTQTEASVRAALRANPVPGLKEVMVLTDQGLGRPFRP